MPTIERNEPSHIHVAGKGGEMKVWIPSMIIEFSYDLSPAEQGEKKWNEFSSKKI